MSFEYKQTPDDLAISQCMELLQTMPRFMTGYLIASEQTTCPQTILSYLRQLDVFFHYLHDNNPYFKKDIRKFTVNDMDQISPSDMEEFHRCICHRSADSSEDPEHAAVDYLNALSSLRSFFLTMPHYQRKEVSCHVI